MLNRASLLARIARLEKRASDPRSIRAAAEVCIFVGDTNGDAYRAWSAEQSASDGAAVINLTIGTLPEPAPAKPPSEDPEEVRRQVAAAEAELAVAQAEIEVAS
jgi:alkanesulfonate monooxygenase SsuD/methylene tetrahydromethanopterin reductase-like flavin-dependent oxidoreductase (luciferase family)